ncbi:pyrimidine/purine nucleoside phosphorylase [Pontibacter beigongshangensis]|uniref:pyrimidine/purine nucleoside phosphorylase n=1 Tax=Pontibacter beigongshangensis TaxID=2574733 RepID=UPI001650AEBF|nr:pyrimidine/purine nucleoside phosphorylase [Pontibacter beigongshangensis]
MIKVNEYFDGAVKSLGYNTEAGRSTVGVMDKGEFEFGTSEHETVLIVEGELTVLLPGAQEWQVFGQGQKFEVPAHVSFKVRVAAPTSYLCQYR